MCALEVVYSEVAIFYCHRPRKLKRRKKNKKLKLLDKM